MPDLRTVVTEPAVDDQLEEIFGSTEAADEAIRGFQAVLCANPEVGTRISESVWFLAMDAQGIWKSIVAYYTFTDGEVGILHVTEAH